MTDILAVLADCQAGEVSIDMSRKLNELVAAVVETNTKGTMTIKLTLAPSKKKDRTVEMAIGYECSIKKPEFSVGTSYFFVTEKGDLSASDPRQDKLFDNETVETGGTRG